MSYKFDSLMAILNKLDSQEKVTVGSLKQDLGVSERTIYRYLNTLQVGGFPIVFNEDQGGYGFMEGYSLKKPNLSTEETLALNISKKMIKGMGSGWEDSMNRIEEKLSIKKADLPRHIILSGKGLPPEITNYIGLIHQAIMDYQRIKIIYSPLYSDDITKRKVDPYYLFFEEDFWYLRGYCHLREEPRTFALDRINSLKVINEHFIPQNITPEEELSAGFGTVIDGEPTEVVLKFDKEIRPYIQRKKWHQSQKERELKDGRLELRFRVNGLEGINYWIYRWLPYVEVVSPKELRGNFVAELEIALKKNDKSRN
jgi:predicted DNA-binding transcriptional regulator YafY